MGLLCALAAGGITLVVLSLVYWVSEQVLGDFLSDQAVAGVMRVIAWIIWALVSIAAVAGFCFGFFPKLLDELEAEGRRQGGRGGSGGASGGTQYPASQRYVCPQ